MTVASRARWPAGPRPDRRDLAVAAVVTLLEVLAPRSGGQAADPSVLAGTVGLLLALVQGMPTVWRRGFPVAVLGIVTAAFLAQALLVQPVPPYGAWVALAALAVRRDARSSAVAAAGVVAALLAGYLGAFGPTDEWVLPALLTVGIGVTGQLVRERRARLVAVAGRAAAEERLRIARDLHDVLGHSLSGIAVQSSTGRMALEADQPDVARAALVRIEEASRSSMAEVRSVLGALRAAAAPRLESVAQLVEEARAEGMSVSFRLDGDTGLVPTEVGQVTYRVVQEGLTNARRHARPAPVSVAVSVVVSTTEMAVTVLDDGREPSPGAAAGHGLAGMRERVESLGGRLDAGPSGDNGWRVHAVLPLTGGRRGSRGGAR